MRTSSTLLLILAMVLGGVAADTNNPRIESQVQKISKDLSENRVGRLRFPRSSADSDPGTHNRRDARKQYHNKLIIPDINSNSYRDKLISSFKTVSVSPRDEMTDLRWAAVFYSQEGDRVGAVYFDKSGQYGAVNSFAASFKGHQHCGREPAHATTHPRRRWDSFKPDLAPRSTTTRAA